MCADQTMQQGDLLPAIERLVTQDRIERYAEASGDFNPIHVDREFAERSRFGSTVAHGMMIAATISEMMASAFRERWLETGQLKLRFKAPVLPGETVTTTGRVKDVRTLDGATQVIFSVEVRKPDDQPAITGEATVTVPEARQEG